MRNALVAALISCADKPSKREARRFLVGLSFDELQFIAEFVGAYALEFPRRGPCSRAQLAEDIARFQRAREGGRRSEDQDHKMILLLEYLCRGGGRQLPAARAAHA